MIQKCSNLVQEMTLGYPRGGQAFRVQMSKVKLVWSISAFSHCPEHGNSKTNDPKVFKLGIGNDLGNLGYLASGIILD